MSHLSTIISRVHKRLEVNPESIDKDSLFLQSVSNLKEYISYYSDFEIVEQLEADELFEKYKHLLIGTIYEDVL